MLLRQKQLLCSQALQNRLSEASKMLAPLQNFRLHFEARAEAKKKMQHLERAMGDIELEVPLSALNERDNENTTDDLYTYMIYCIYTLSFIWEGTVCDILI